MKQVCDIEQNLSLFLLIVAVAHIDCSEDVHHHAIEWFLIEITLLGYVIFVQFLSNKFKNLAHEFAFIEVESLEQHDYQLNKTIDKTVVKSIVICSSFPITCVESQLYTVFYHNVAELIQHLFILVDS